MSLILGEQQCFFVIVLAFAVIGFQRGWRRELVSLGFSLAAGGNGMAQLIFVRLPIIANVVVGSSSQNAQGTARLPDNTVLITAIITFLVVVIVGYIVGNRVFPKPTQPQERLFGILPAIISGYFMLLYVTNVVQAPLITLGVKKPNQNEVASYVLVIFVIAVGVVLTALISTSVRKPGPKK
jgi:hypothetical protein